MVKPVNLDALSKWVGHIPEDVLHHEKQINKPNGISLSKVERSSDQVTIYGLC